MTQIRLGDLRIDVVRKAIKHVHLSVHPPTGRVRIAAPERIRLDTLRVFAIGKLDWIRRQQQALRAQARATPRDYVERESHQVWGRRYLLSVRELDAPPRVELRPRSLLLQVRLGTDRSKREAFLEDWYRSQLRQAVLDLVALWALRLGVTVERVHIQRMRTQWGSCNPRASSIRLNTELAKKPRECLQYIVVHELMHLLEPRHGERFRALMDHALPSWQAVRAELNRLPVRHERWNY